MANIDWLAIKNEYINTNISQRKLAEKYGISRSTLEKRAKKEKWSANKKEQCGKIEAKVGQKTAEIIVSAEVDRVKKMLTLTDKVQEQIETALGQLDKHVYMFGNVSTCEVVDVNRLKKLAAALKDVRDIVREDKASDGNGIFAKLVEEFENLR